MIKLSVWHGDLSDSYLKQVTQLGANCIDFGGGDYFPGVKEQGYPDLDGVLKIRKKIRSWGLDINRVTLPDITGTFMESRDGAGKELENTCKALRVFAEADVPIARQRFAGDTYKLPDFGDGLRGTRCEQGFFRIGVHCTHGEK